MVGSDEHHGPYEVALVFLSHSANHLIVGHEKSCRQSMLMERTVEGRNEQSQRFAIMLSRYRLPERILARVSESKMLSSEGTDAVE